MTERTMSPTAAAAHARKAIRARLKALRLDPRPVAEVPVDSPDKFAGRLVAFAAAAAQDPGPYSHEWHEHVVAQFSSQYLRLSEVAPVKARRS